MRLVLDTNVIVAGLAYPSGPPGRIVAAWRSGAIQVVFSPWILTECQRVLPRLRQYTSLAPDGIRDLVDSLAFAADVIEPDPDALTHAAGAGVRDVADEPVLALLIAGNVEMLVTGDKDLLALSDRYLVLSPAQFCASYAP